MLCVLLVGLRCLIFLKRYLSLWSMKRQWSKKWWSPKQSRSLPPKVKRNRVCVNVPLVVAAAVVVGTVLNDVEDVVMREQLPLQLLRSRECGLNSAPDPVERVHLSQQESVVEIWKITSVKSVVLNAGELLHLQVRVMEPEAVKVPL
jgi:hypothetical protein